LFLGHDIFLFFKGTVSFTQNFLQALLANSIGKLSNKALQTPITKTLTFVRHAIPLSGLGELQADMLSTLLLDKSALILTSSFLRAQHTASPFEQRIETSATDHPLLHEFYNFDLSLIAGMNVAIMREIQTIREYYTALQRAGCLFTINDILVITGEQVV
jgi:Histidine phosphatase superfamily (branch 1)